ICPHPKRQGVWKLDPTGTPTWRIGIVRTEDSDTADLLLEPHEDVFDQVFTLTITYEEGEPVKVTTKVTTHTDTQLKMNATAAQPAATDSGPARVTMHLEAGDRVRGELLELTKELIKLRTAWSSEMEIPLLGVLGVEFGSSPAADAKQRFQEHLHKPGTEDTALVRGQDQAITAVSGKLEGLADGKVRFAYEGEIRSINQPRLIGLVFAAHPTTPRGVEPYQIFQFTSGDKLSGSWTAIDGESLELLTPWNRRERVPAAAVSEVSFRNGKMVYLSDLEPATVEEVPYFGRLLTYRRDQNLFGQPLKMKGKTYAKGLAVHSRCTLSYQIDGRFATFKCLAGFDDSAGGRGRVLCRVLGDGKELFVEKDLRGDQEPRPVEVTIADVKQLTLEVDFGEAEDTGDRVIWADPQLFRSPTN
ncbi:MAG: NPCBM/NEW2 domain-containing protein, partial [Planctomycetes bacterium]|nr:NPCBM/NEW2 domain-containing protein [Planctomycetota bacterium]